MSNELIRSSLSDQVADHLLHRITGERMVPGDRLPSERQLGEEFGVSRTVVREAIRLLSARGLVSSRSGSGIVVAQVNPQIVSETITLFLRGEVEDYRAVHEVREMLEVNDARLAAQRAAASDLTALRTAHDAMVTFAQEPDDVEHLSLADVEFHRVLARSTGNPLHVMLLDAIGLSLIQVRRANLISSDGRAEALAAHGAILDAVCRGAVEEAEAAMRAHLNAVIETWSTSVLRHHDGERSALPRPPRTEHHDAGHTEF